MTVLALDLAATIHHDGQGGLRDTLADDAGVSAWIECARPLVEEVLGRPHAVLPAPEVVGPALVELRGVVRALFGRAAAPTRVEAVAPLDPATALRRLNRTADHLGTAHLTWSNDSVEPAATWSTRTSDPLLLLTGAVARSTIDFLTGPDRARLRACPAARCVRYFLQADPRQSWCSPSCGNRERVNRHYRNSRDGGLT